MGKIFKGDVGIDLRVDTKIDLTGATKTVLRVQKPNKQEVEWTATVSETELRYTTTSPDFNIVGVYLISAYVEFGATSKHAGETAELTVYEPLARG